MWLHLGVLPGCAFHTSVTVPSLPCRWPARSLPIRAVPPHIQPPNSRFHEPHLTPSCYRCTPCCCLRLLHSLLFRRLLRYAGMYSTADRSVACSSSSSSITSSSDISASWLMTCNAKGKGSTTAVSVLGQHNRVIKRAAPLLAAAAASALHHACKQSMQACLSSAGQGKGWIVADGQVWVSVSAVPWLCHMHLQAA